MKNYLGNFFKRARAESWDSGVSFEQLDLREGFTGYICFSEEHFVECQIEIDEVTIYDSFTDKNHEYMFDAFSEYVQNEMKENILEKRDREETEYRLGLTAHW